MLIVLSPAKTLDFDTPLPPHPATKPVLLSQSVELNQLLRQQSPAQLASLMHISAELARLNYDRNAAWTLPFTKRNARQALFAFRGDVYVGLEADNFSDDDLAFAQQHLRILSGLYGALRPLDLVPLLHTAVETLRPLAAAGRVAISLSVPPGPVVTVGDAARLEQVVWNLLANAVNFTAPGGHVALRLEQLGWLVQLEVEDDGQGIEPAFLPQVFDRFRQADSSSTRAVGGLGLGLALVRHVVLAHGGQVVARSDGAGRGACFTVSLPRGMGEPPDPASPSRSDPTAAPREGEAWSAAEPPSAPAIAAMLAGLQVLVVEDHDDSRELLADFLVAQGASVHAAADAREAMTRVRSLSADGPPAVLLCDIGLPGRDGYALLDEIREHERQSDRPPGMGIAAFAMSAFTRAEDRERSLRAGFLAHLDKPLSQGELIEHLVRLRDASDTTGGVRLRAPR
jgi:CheY-like chemotaxis protein